MKNKKKKDLTYTQRLQLEAYLKTGTHKRVIAANLGISLATVYREIKRGRCIQKKIRYTDYWGERHYKYVTAYSPNLAEEKYRLNMTAKGAPLKLGNDYNFVRYMEKRVLEDKLSPCAVLGEIKRNKMFRTDISKTTLYRYIEQGIFPNLKMSDCPMHRKKNKYRKAVAKRPPKGVSIEKRPLAVLSRQSFGHWEMDCVIGRRYTKDTLLCFTERLTRYEIIIKMPDHKSATVVKSLNKLEKRFGKNFRKIFKSITVDNGVEFSDFKGLQKSIYGGKRVEIYYCHPYTSCERGSNERLNRDIRRLLPKGTDFTQYSDEQIKAVENWVNAYPRRMFGYATAADMFAEQLAQMDIKSLP